MKREKKPLKEIKPNKDCKDAPDNKFNPNPFKLISGLKKLKTEYYYIEDKGVISYYISEASLIYR